MTDGRIVRDLAGAAGDSYDLIIAGGGIQGIMLALEASRRSLRPLLLERGDFAGATSHNSLRILHGGLRYLQSLDLARCHESIRARAFWLRAFPELVAPLACVIPLSGRGAYRPAVFRSAIAINDGLCRLIDGGLLPRGRILAPATAAGTLPAIGIDAAAGAGVWHDAYAQNGPRVCIEALRWACAEGAVTLNYVEAREVVVTAGRVAGIRAHDLETGREHAFEAPLVINATGPSGLAPPPPGGRGNAPDPPSLLAWNVLFERAAIADFGLAMRASRTAAQTYFAVPWQGRLCVGTGYTPWHGGATSPRPSPRQLALFIDELNEAAPGLGLDPGEMLRVYAGLLPATPDGRAPSNRPRVQNHARDGGPVGLWSVTAVKFTTARALAERMLQRALPQARPSRDLHRPAYAAPQTQALRRPDSWAPADLRRLVADEAVIHLDDLLLRRLGLGDDPGRALAAAPEVCRALGWDARRTELEQRRLRGLLGRPAADAMPGQGDCPLSDQPSPLAHLKEPGSWLPLSRS